MTGPERAVQLWQVLIAAAHDRRTLTYRLLGETIDLAPSLLAAPLGLVARYCAAKQWPPLTVLVVQAGDGRPGAGFAWATDADGAREAVYVHDWFKLRPPSAADFALIDDIGIGAAIE